MNMSPLEFCPVASPAAPLPQKFLGDVAEGSQPEFCAIGPPAFSEVIAEAEQLVQAAHTCSNVSCLVIPVGTFGRLLWTGLPASLALKVATVRLEAILVWTSAARTRIEKADTAPATLADLLADLSAEQVQVLDTIQSKVFDPDLPALVPVSKTLTARQRSWVLAESEVPVQAGLAHILGDIDRSHEFAQSIEGRGSPRHGDYWHAIIHRREPDYSNARYWLRSVGSHPVYSQLGTITRELFDRSSGNEEQAWLRRLTAGGWDAAAFIDCCRECSVLEETPAGIMARQIQWAEMLLLMQASAGSGKSR